MAAVASFNSPNSLDIDAAGNIYVADYYGHKIRKITPDGAVTTLAGSGVAGYLDGDGASAMFNVPSSVAVDAAGNVYVAERVNNAVRKVAPNGFVSTIVGKGIAGSMDGPASYATVNQPGGIALDGKGNLIIVDSGNSKIRLISGVGAFKPVSTTNTSAKASPTSKPNASASIQTSHSILVTIVVGCIGAWILVAMMAM